MQSLLLSFIISKTLTASITPAKLFFIQRSKNSNEVHYELQHEPDCSVKKSEPVRGYWQELEKGPNIVSDITVFEQPAYGVSDQKVEGEWVYFKMKAIPERDFKAKVIKKDGTCLVEAFTTINKEPSVLKKIYIFAVEGFIRPKVKYIDLFGVSNDGKEVKERINY